MSEGIGICDAGRHLVGLESPTYSKGKFQESNQKAEVREVGNAKVREFCMERRQLAGIALGVA